MLASRCAREKNVDQDGPAPEVANAVAARVENDYTAEKVKSLKQELEVSLQAN